jgi:pimeloyl-ACP methyl ester carboxylesterase
MLDPETLPAWLKEQDLDYYTGEFERTGFGGTLNWYRTFEQSWELMAAWTGARLHSPALYMVGERDTFLSYPGSRELIAGLPTFAPALKETILLPGGGHYLQQECPTEVNAALIKFLKELPPSG